MRHLGVEKIIVQPEADGGWSFSGVGDLTRLVGGRKGVGGSNCLPCQALTATGGFHAVRRAIIALRIVRSFRIHAVRATFFGLPAATSRS